MVDVGRPCAALRIRVGRDGGVAGGGVSGRPWVSYWPGCPAGGGRRAGSGADITSGDGRLSRSVPDGPDRVGERQRLGFFGYFVGAGARAGADQRDAPLPANRGGHGQHVGERNSGRAGAIVAGYRPRPVPAFTGRARKAPRAAGCGKYFIQDSGGEFERAEPGRVSSGQRSRAKTVKGRNEHEQTQNLTDDWRDAGGRLVRRAAGAGAEARSHAGSLLKG